MKGKCCKRCGALYAKHLQSERGCLICHSRFKLKPDWLPSVCFRSDDSESRWGHRGARSNLKPWIYLPGNHCYLKHFLSSACNGGEIPESGSV